MTSPPIFRTATVYELRNGEPRAEWHPVAELSIGRQRPATALSIWVEENDPCAGTYRLLASDGGWAEVWLADDRVKAAAGE